MWGRYSIFDNVDWLCVGTSTRIPTTKVYSRLSEINDKRQVILTYFVGDDDGEGIRFS